VEFMDVKEFDKLFKNLEETGVFEQVSERISQTAFICATSLKEKNVTDDEFIVPLVTTVTTEAVRQALYLSLL